MRQTPPDSNPRKRRRSNQCSFELEVENGQIVEKKPKDVDVADPQPAISQDNLSATPLRKDALRTLNRENKQAARDFRSSQQILRPRFCRPITRRALAEWTRRHPPVQPSESYLESCGHEQSEALKSFARNGGPDLRDLSGCQKAAVEISNPMQLSQGTSTCRRTRSRQSSRTKATTDNGSNKSISPYNKPFEQLLVDSHIYPPYYEYPDGTAAPEPANLKYIHERLAQRRPSLSPSKFSKNEHKAYVRKDVNTANEDDVRRSVIPIIQGTIKDPKTLGGEVLFVNLAPFTTDEKVASGRPDFYHGARPEQLRRPIRKELSHLITPSAQENLAILPSHFTAVKGPDGHVSIAKRQATYDAYFGARGIHALQNYGQTEPCFDNKAYTFAFIYHSPTLSAFVCHPVQPADPGESPSYYMTPVGSFSMLHNAESWKEGATWYRNAIDLAKEWRDEFIRLANNILQAPTAAVTPSVSTSFASTGDQLRAPTGGSRNDDAASGIDEASEIAERSEAEERETLPEQSSRPRRQMRLGKKRQDREDSEDVGRTVSSPQAGALRSSSIAKRQKARKRRG